MLTPAHFIHSRLATDHLYVVACVLMWLLRLVQAGETVTPRRVLMATMFLGASV